MMVIIELPKLLRSTEDYIMGGILSCVRSFIQIRRSSLNEEPDLYSVLKNYDLPEILEPSFWDLPKNASLEEKNERALVFLDIYLTTEVISPAIERYLKEINKFKPGDKVYIDLQEESTSSEISG